MIGSGWEQKEVPFLPVRQWANSSVPTPAGSREIGTRGPSLGLKVNSKDPNPIENQKLKMFEPDNARFPVGQTSVASSKCGKLKEC